MINPPENNFRGSEKPKKKKKKNNDVLFSEKEAEAFINKIFSNHKKKKKPTGILKDLMSLKRGYIKGVGDDIILVAHKRGAYVEWSDVEQIIKKYENP